MVAVKTENKRENKGHNSPGIISNGMLYISGQLSVDPDTGRLPEGGIEEHMHQALSNVELVLKAAGLERDSVVQCRIYLVDIANWDAVNEAYRAFFGEHKPARIVVPVPALHFGCMVEIEALAEGIAIGKPIRGEEILEKIYQYDMDIVEIPEDGILPARAALAKQGIYCEHTTAGNYAAYLKYCEEHGRTPDSLITMCGAGLKSDH